MMKKAIWIGLFLSVVGVVAATNVRGDEDDRKTVEVASADQLKTAPIVAVTPEQKETSVLASIQTTPASSVAQRSWPAAPARAELPNAASPLALLALLSLALISASIGLMIYRRRAAPVPVR